MSDNMLPFNITLLNITDKTLANIKPVTVMDRFEGGTRNFHENGLFSVSIFGRVGDERRNRAFSYIDVKADVFHPVIYRALTDTRAMYGDIINGTVYAIWNPELKDFEKSNPMDGLTGFDFFVKHWKDIVFEERPSVQREQNIAVIYKYKEVALTSKIIVMPAGLRDLEISDDGRTSEDEINSLYISLLSLSQAISKETYTNNPEIINNVRSKIQNKFNEIYDLLENLIQGKHKLIMGKWVSRKVFNTTRNVITSMAITSNALDYPGNISLNDTVVGLYQFMKASLPVSIFNIKSGFLSQVFTAANNPVILVNKKTYKKEQVHLKPMYYDAWMTTEGIEKVISSFSDTNIRHKPLEINGHYLGLIYKGKDNAYKMFSDIDELPHGFDKSLVTPITFCELLYLSVYQSVRKYACLFTRYPITGLGSIYPSKIYLKPTIKCEVRTELNHNWEIDSDSATAYQFPVDGSEFMNSLSPSAFHLGKLGADFDGDIK